MKYLPFSKIRNLVLITALCILCLGIGYRTGQKDLSTGLPFIRNAGSVRNTAPPANLSLDFSLFWDVWQKIFRHYVDASSLNADKMIEGAITGMVTAVGDPYTSFFPPKENQAFKEDLGGAFEGIGAQLGEKDNHVVIITPLKGNPAEKAGIRAGDIILKINGEDATGWKTDQAVAKIRGPRGTTVTLAILHEGAHIPVDITITRETITVPSVVMWMKNINDIQEISAATEAASFKNRTDGVAYLDLTRFGDRTNDEWLQAVSDILNKEQAGKKPIGLIFDLRNNPGGYLDGAVFIASEFVKGGTVVSQVNSDGTKEDFPVDRKGKLLDIPLVVLVNKGSASAAEIVAGALHDFKRATLVGETTFGKGSVQTPYDLAGGAALHVTTGKWLLPSGLSISKQGVKPDIEVKLTSFDASSDAQLAKAVEILLK